MTEIDVQRGDETLQFVYNEKANAATSTSLSKTQKCSKTPIQSDAAQRSLFDPFELDLTLWYTRNKHWVMGVRIVSL